jgi:aspartyl/asparaginyl-tRNA synthetase
MQLQLEATIEITGTLNVLGEGKTAPDGHEVRAIALLPDKVPESSAQLKADWWRLLGGAPGGRDAIQTRISKDTEPSILADARHLQIRGETAASVLKMRSALLDAFRATLKQLGCLEVTPPCIVQTQVECAAFLFAPSRALNRRTGAAAPSSALTITVRRPTSLRAVNSTSRPACPVLATCSASSRASAPRRGAPV